ncbi:hypothetical protein [Vibrio panuliri]|uniref:Uncharacterized protein n=1 Tax=Vibrio panuliri TaxID=1381081 RepID=A0ABX3FSQ3_9VIBR|nr:hypothetical protein [Vibrio panuliri]KAB1457196.1 hypothetical protein F7O85_05450 [Vibrio panuliri]OLQ96234.1 hypothetical protein BIY20_19750 [Vibrio panuliri]
MDKYQGIIEFLAMSGILPLAILVFLFLAGFGLILLIVFAASKSKTDSQSAQGNNDIQSFEKYYDPGLPERACQNCLSSIKKGRVVCDKCGKLDSRVVSI